MGKTLWTRLFNIILALMLSCTCLTISVASAVDSLSSGGMPKAVSTDGDDVAKAGDTGSGGSGGGGGGGNPGSGGIIPPPPPPPTPPAIWINPFEDVREGDWFYYPVLYVSKNGLMDGTSANMFSPNALVNRGMISAFIYNMDGRPDVTGLTNPFSDMADSHPYTNAVKWVTHISILAGYSDGAFYPDYIINHESMVSILYNYANRRGLDVSSTTDLSGYVDIYDVGEWALAAMKWAIAEGITTGIPGAMIAPKRVITRAEFAAIIQRFVERTDYGLKNYDFILPVKHQTSAPEGYIPIYTAEDLDAIRDDVVDAEIGWINKGYANINSYILMNDIDLAEWGEWKPIGDSETSFAGTFDGNGYVIRNMTITKPDSFIGLFGASFIVVIKDTSGYNDYYTSRIINLGLVNANLPVLPSGLKDLYCGGNQLKKLPDILPPALSHLSCESNQLTELPTLPSGLAELYCQDNPLKSLIPLPAGLKTLDCDTAQLTSLPTLPSGLEYLYCRHNQLTSLPLLPLGLIALWCNDNKLDKLPSLPGSLESLICSNNRLTELDISGIQLRTLWCTYNNMKSPASGMGFTDEWRGVFLFYPQNNLYTITATPETSGGTVSGSDTYFEGTTVVLIAKPNNDYAFNGWYENDVEVTGAGATYSFTATVDRTLQARFISTKPNNPPPSGGGGGASATNCTVTFNTNGGSPVSSQNVATGNKAVKPIDPTRSGFVFEGWYSDAAMSTPYDFNSTVTAGLTIYAKWTEAINIDEPETPNTPLPAYTDVADTDWFYDAVHFVTEKGLMEGTGNGRFSPNVTMTRAMLVTVLYRLEGKPTVSGDIPFTDVARDQWYSDAILWASQNNIVDGYSNGTFGWNDNITREQAVTILYRYAKAKGANANTLADLSKFSDAKDISDWALDAMGWAVAAGIIEGRSANIVAPEYTSTRAEVATIFKRYIENFLGKAEDFEE